MKSYDIVAPGAPLQARARPDQQPDGSEVLLKTLATGVCHTDVHLWEGYFNLGGGKRLQMTERGITLPHTLGHEVVGEVIAIGPDAVGVAVGDRRLIHPWIGCGHCQACARGDEHYCTQPRYLGVFKPGGFADQILVPHPRYLHDFGAFDPADVAPLACSGLTTFSALKKIGLDVLVERPIVLIGAGGLGLMCLEILRLLGAKGAFVADIDPLKRRAAEDAGALAVVDAGASDGAARLIEATDGGAAAVIDFVGVPQTVQLGLDCLAKGGKLVVVGMFGGEITLSIPSLLLRGLTIQASYVGSPAEMAELMQLVRSKGCPQIPIARRALGCAQDALQQLRDGQVVGRIVLVPESDSPT